MPAAGKDEAEAQGEKSSVICSGEYETASPEETFLLGKTISGSAEPGELLVLEGELGAGKTLFAKGFAEGLGVDETVVSPTFTLLRVYISGRLPLYHFDLYRLESEDEFFEIGGEEYFDGKGICLLEWAYRYKDILPEPYTLVRIEKLPDKGDDARSIVLLLRCTCNFQN